MALPPFPPQDLAKLVLGYLAEEQLMTAYDEFLQESPYLDVFRNEFDRIFMTSLRSILAEYRAIKIYVETCKPHSLRKKLFQCSNLLEVVKCLVSLIDPYKLQVQESYEKPSCTKQPEISKSSLISDCDVCNSMNLSNCVCKHKNSNIELSTKQNPSSGLEMVAESVEATPLAELPGDCKEASAVPCISLSSVPIGDNICTNVLYNPISVADIHSQSVHSLQVNKDPLKDEFNSILQKICNKSSTTDTEIESIVSNGNLASNVCQSKGFKEFASGVAGSDNNMRLPDYKTPIHIPIAPKPNISPITNIKGPPEVQELYPNNSNMRNSLDVNRAHDSKVTILSDVKVDKCYPCTSFKPTSSTPLMQMKTMLINGTPAYTKKSQISKMSSYSKDEIMAMPTIIIVPSSGPHKCITSQQVAGSNRQNCNTTAQMNVKTTVTKAPVPDLMPLTVNVSSVDIVPTQSIQLDTSSAVLQTVTKSNGIGLIKTVDTVVHASLPKENTVLDKIGTPHVLPPVRKSSSTPRRTSHVRVLDFATPRRILDHEKIPNNDDVVIICDSPKTTETKSCNTNIIKPVINISQPEAKVKTTKQNSFVKKRNWDDDLRGLLASCDTMIEQSLPKKNKKTKNKCGSNDRPEKKKQALKKGGTVKVSVSENESNKLNSDVVEIDRKNVPVSRVKDTLKDNNNTNNCEDLIETPETERLCLQNEIGAKLNISDLLETPYKQAIYDIQMGTPRFLGPELLDEPVSDIKIMNIPTPRFLTTPQPAQATPSYSSRPTDYSSGGSYYKPDDDYIHIPIEAELNNIEVPNVKNKSSSIENGPKDEKYENKDKSEDKGKSSKGRPVRKCTKNVSYYNSPNINVSDNDKQDKLKSGSLLSVKKDTNRPKPKVGKNNKDKENIKCKNKSPCKKDSSKIFLKIKPRRVTPIKDVSKNKVSPSRCRKKSVSKDKTEYTNETESLAPIKSRRKSSTPRKLHCTKLLNSSNNNNNLPDTFQSRDSVDLHEDAHDVSNADHAQKSLRRLDDKPKNKTPNKTDTDSQENTTKESDDIITKIKEYIEDTIDTVNPFMNERTGNLQNDLIKRGFDVETARILERDLLDTPPIQDGAVQSTSGENTEYNSNKSQQMLVTNKEQITLSKADACMGSYAADDEDDDVEDLDFTVHENNLDCNNFFNCVFDENNSQIKSDITVLKDKFSMEVCIDDGVTIRLRAIDFKVLFEQDAQNVPSYDVKETESAVNSICNIDKLYTPIKDHKAKCFEIFDSTLTSIDTPLKANSPTSKEHENTSTSVVFENDNLSVSRMENKKRKRLQSGADDNASENKKSKPDKQYLLDPANIQNIDIESVLSKLHGP
ncbi:unnamed protein product [Leptidea sinapis]|uniref:LisH domain-containing protein n=1 Tax=Leptidea sinapis TaxID=189913 RepID=A0A5E4QU14_9NEOP|nr:unnamed protein product [Leptidea sinapis]